MSFVVFDASFEYVVFVPEIENFLLSLQKIERRVNFFIHNSSVVAKRTFSFRPARYLSVFLFSFVFRVRTPRAYVMLRNMLLYNSKNIK